MKMYRYITCIIVPGLLITSVLSDECIYEVCRCDDIFIYCDGIGLTAIPPLLKYKVGQYTNLAFSENWITTIPAGSLPSGLTQISFDANPIASIDNDAFIGSATTLQTLIFSMANLGKIPNALLPLKNLVSLDISDTDIVDWNDEVMRSIGGTIQSLIFDNVTLNVWPNWIQSYVNLTEVSLVECNLALIPDDGLDMVAHTLTSLTLTRNSLTTVPRAISKLTALQMLYMEGNRITDTRWLPAVSKINSLALSNNLIFNSSQLSQSLLSISSYLTDLDLVDNKLTTIPDLNFLKFKGFDLSYNMITDPYSGTLPADLLSIDMSHNLLPTIPFAVLSLASLSELRISSNSIKEIEGAKLPKNITFLDLGNNLITEVNNASFPIILPIVTLILSNNPITKISSNAFQNLPNLVDLELGNTKLTRMPLALSALKMLNLLDLSGIPGFVCTCLEKSLGPLLLSLSPDNLLGDCGGHSIHDFFTKLSPSCP